MAWIAAANILPIYATHVHSSTSTVKHSKNILEIRAIIQFDNISLKLLPSTYYIIGNIKLIYMWSSKMLAYSNKFSLTF